MKTLRVTFVNQRKIGAGGAEQEQTELPTNHALLHQQKKPSRRLTEILTPGFESNQPGDGHIRRRTEAPDGHLPQRHKATHEGLRAHYLRKELGKSENRNLFKRQF